MSSKVGRYKGIKLAEVWRLSEGYLTLGDRFRIQIWWLFHKLLWRLKM